MNLAALHKFQKHVSESALLLTGEWTPHKLMDCLKEGNPESIKDSKSLTPLGAFLKAALPRHLSKSLDLIKWITLHLHYPGKPFGSNEFDIRNWIAIQQQDQPLIDRVHSDTIRHPTDQLKDMYAPSLIAGRLRDSTSPRKAWINKRWLFRMPEQIECNICERIPCKQPRAHLAKFLEFHRDNTLCFNPQSVAPTHIYLAIRSCQPSDAPESSTTLGALLNEPEEVAARNFANFANLVLDVPGNSTGLRANYYYRIPKQWPGEDSYLTEITVALRGEAVQAKQVFALLEPLDIILSNVVALINSEVAFQIGEKRQKERQREQFHRSHLHYKHTVNNLSPALSLDLKHARNALENDARKAATKLSDAIKTNDVLTMVYTCSLGSCPQTIETIPSMLDWLASRLRSSEADVLVTISTKRNYVIPSEHRHAAFLTVWNLWYNAVVAQTNYNEQYFQSARQSKFRVSLDEKDDRLLLTFTNNPAIAGRYAQYLNLMGEGDYPVKDTITQDESGLEIVMLHARGLSWTIRAEVSSDTTAIKVNIPLPETTT